MLLSEEVHFSAIKGGIVKRAIINIIPIARTLITIVRDIKTISKVCKNVILIPFIFPNS